MNLDPVCFLKTLKKKLLKVVLHFFFFTALQVDLNRHTFEGVRITSNAGNGLEILYSDLYNSLSYIRNSEFSGNKGAGISFKQLGLTVEGEYLV